MRMIVVKNGNISIYRNPLAISLLKSARQLQIDATLFETPFQKAMKQLLPKKENSVILPL